MQKEVSIQSTPQQRSIFSVLICCLLLGVSHILYAEEPSVALPSGTEVLFSGDDEGNEEYALLRQQLSSSRGGSEINKKDESGLTPLMHAARLNDRLVVAWLLAKNASIEITDNEGKIAADYTTDESIREAILLCRSDKRPLTPEEKAHLGEIPYADLADLVARTGDDSPSSLRMLVTLLRSGQNARDIAYHPGMQLLFSSILFRHWFDIRKAADDYYEGQISPDVLRLATALGFRVDTRDSLKQLLFAEAINDTNLMRAILNREPHLLRRNEKLGQIVGQLTSAAGLQVLIDFGLNTKLRWKEQKSAVKATLIYSVFIRKASPDVIRALVDAGVPLPSLRENTNPITFYIYSAGDSVDAVQALIQAGADINKTGTPKENDSISGVPPVVAAASSSPQILRFLLSKGADPNAATIESDGKPAGAGPLHAAAKAGRADIIRLLLEAKADPNKPEETTGYTPLHYAVLSGRVEAVRELLTAGARTDACIKLPPNATMQRGSILELALAGFTARSGGKRPDFYNKEQLQILRLLFEAGLVCDPQALTFPLNADLPLALREEIGSLLLDRGADPLATSKGKTSLINYCSGGPTISKRLLEAGVPINAVAEDGSCALDQAVAADNKPVIDLLRSSGAQMVGHVRMVPPAALQRLIENGLKIPSTAFDDIRFTSSHLADSYSKSDLHQVASILKSAGADPAWALLRHAEHEFEPTRVLINIGFDPNATNANGETPLMMCSDSSTIVPLLLNMGAKVNAVDKSGKNVLIHAINYGYNIIVINSLLRAGADPKATDFEGNSALSLAVKKGFFDLIKPFADHGCKAEAKTLLMTADEAGNTPLMRALLVPNIPQKVIRELIAFGSDVNARNAEGKSPLHIIADQTYNTNSIVQLLFKAKADINAQSKDGTTPLMVVCGMKDPAKRSWRVAQFIRGGANVDIQDSAGNTAAMHIANMVDDAENIGRLLDAGAKIHLKNKEGKTLPQIAKENNREKILKLLEERKAEK